MRSSAFVVATVFLVSFVAVSQSGVINEPFDEVEPLSLIDPIIKGILESMRPKLANIKLDDINQSVTDPRLNATIKATNMQIQNLDKFNIQVLKSNLLPLRLANLTLTWRDINAEGSYDVNVNVATPHSTTPLRVFGEGDARASLKDVFVTIGANMEMKGTNVQVKPKGFFGFDFSISKANVSISSLMGSPELGKVVSVFISEALPELINALKKPVFDALHDDIVRIVNEILTNKGKTLLDEQPETGLSGLDLSEMFDSALFQKSLNLGLEETESEDDF